MIRSKDFEPISAMALVQNVLVVNPSLPVANVSDLIRSRGRTPASSITRPAVPAPQPLRVSPCFVALAGIQNDTVHVPYKGGASAMTATIANETAILFRPVAG